MNRPWLEALPEASSWHPHAHERLSLAAVRIDDVDLLEDGVGFWRFYELERSR